MLGRLFICCLMFSLNVAAQENKPALMDLIHQVQQYLDSAAKRKVDARYIEVPAKPWRVILRYKETAFDVDYSNSAGAPAAGDGVDWQLGFKPPTSPSVGIWAGYQGTGVSFAKSLRKKEGTTLSFSTTGAMYGFNFRLRRFEMDEASVTATIYEDDKVEQNLCTKIPYLKEENHREVQEERHIWRTLHHEER